MTLTKSKLKQDLLYLAKEVTKQARAIEYFIETKFNSVPEDRLPELERYVREPNLEQLKLLLGPSKTEIRAEAQRLKIREYWKRPVEDLLEELHKHPESIL